MTEIIDNAEQKASDMQKTMLEFYGALITVGDTAIQEIREAFAPHKEDKDKDGNTARSDNSPLPPHLKENEVDSSLLIPPLEENEVNNSPLPLPLKENQTDSSLFPPSLEKENADDNSLIPPSFQEENQADSLENKQELIKFQIWQQDELIYSKDVNSGDIEADFLSPKQANQIELLKLMPEGVTIKDFASFKIVFQMINEQQVEIKTVFETDSDGLITKNINTAPSLSNNNNQESLTGAELINSRYKDGEQPAVISDLIDDINSVVNSSENIKRSVDMTPADEIVEQTNIPQHSSDTSSTESDAIPQLAEEIKGYIKFYLDQELKTQENQVLDYIKQRKSNPRQPNLVTNLISKFTQKASNIIETINNVIEQRVNDNALSTNLEFLFNSKDKNASSYVFSSGDNSSESLFIYKDARGNLHLQNSGGSPLDFENLTSENRQQLLERIDQEVSLAKRQAKKRQLSQTNHSYQRTR